MTKNQWAMPSGSYNILHNTFNVIYNYVIYYTILAQSRFLFSACNIQTLPMNAILREKS